MDQTLYTPEVYDFRQYDRIWQRVAPNLEPYPGVTAGPASAQQAVPGQGTAFVQGTAPVSGMTPAQGAAPVQQTAPVQGAASARSEAASPAASVPAAPARPAVPETPAVPVPAAGSGLTAGQLAALPGAEQNPCCMGSAALEMLNVITGYAEAALSDRRYLLALVRQAPSWARQTLRDIAEDLQTQARQLMAAYYLITGRCYRPSVSMERIYVGRWCPALRERYHAAACSGLNYARSAEDTMDPCLTKLFEDMSEQSYGLGVVFWGVL